MIRSVTTIALLGSVLLLAMPAWSQETESQEVLADEVLADEALGEAVLGEAALLLPVKRAKVSSDSVTGDPLLLVWLSREGQRRFAEFTFAHQGARIDVMAAGEVLTSPRVQTPIQSEFLMISGAFSREEIERLAQELSGADGAISVRLHRP